MLFIAPEIPAGLKLDYDIISGTVLQYLKITLGQPWNYSKASLSFEVKIIASRFKQASALRYLSVTVGRLSSTGVSQLCLEFRLA